MTPHPLAESIAILERTPAALQAMLRGLPAAWTQWKETGERWSPFDVVGHLIHGERTDWIPRARSILDHGEGRTFEPFDRFAQFKEPQGKSLEELLDEFTRLRAAGLEALRSWELTPADLERRGRHPEFGPVTLRELLATWVVHDLSHVSQIAREMAVRYRHEVGPWRAYLSIVQ
ncbi:MAG: DinB family protein [Bryobacteraceae bacterium]|nr:DinB family protein [Bryobacteraceae bacterium]